MKIETAPSEIKKAKIINFYSKEIKAIVDGKEGFIKRKNIDWGDPYIEFYGNYQVKQEVDVVILVEYPEYKNTLILTVRAHSQPDYIFTSPGQVEAARRSHLPWHCMKYDFIQHDLRRERDGTGGDLEKESKGPGLYG